MGKRYEGVRERKPGKRYEVYWRPSKGAKRIHRNIEATSIADAYYKRQQVIAEYVAKFVSEEDGKRLSSCFAEMLEALKRNLAGDLRQKKTISHYENTFWRMFRVLRKLYEKKPSNVLTSWGQIILLSIRITTALT